MLTKLVYFLCAFLLAWHFGGAMSSVFWFMPVNEIAEFVAPRNVFNQNAAFYVGLVIWSFVFWTILKTTGITGLASPAQGASNTKLVRRIQGLMAEGVLVAVFCIPVMALLIVSGFGRTIILDNMEREQGPRFIESATAPLLAQVQEIDQTTTNNNAQKFALKGRKVFEHVKDLFKPTENQGVEVTRVQRQIENLQLTDTALKVNRQHVAAEIEQLSAAYSRGDAATVAYVRDAAWRAAVARPWHLAHIAIKSLWFYALPVGGVLYFLLHRKVKYQFAGRVEKILRFFQEMRLGLGGSSAMAGLMAEWALRRDPEKLGDGIFMGRSLYDPNLYLSLNGDRHMISIADSRTGKGTTLIIPTLMEWTGSAVVIDVKGTNAAVTARCRREMGQEVLIIDPFHIVNDESDGYNPLANLDPNSPTIREEIAIIADAMVIPNPDPRSKHWDDGARMAVAGCIDYLISSGKYDNPTLPMIRDVLSMGPDEQAERWADMAITDSVAGLARDAANRIIRGIDGEEITSILSNFDAHTDWLASKPIQAVLSQNGPSPFAMAKEKPTTIYLVLPPHFLETHKRFLRLFINLCIMQISIGGRASIPNLLILDEFLQLGPLAEVQKAYNLMAGYNLIIWALPQNYGGMVDLYGSAVDAFVGNSRAVQVFGASDTRTAKFISEKVGEYSLQDALGSHKSNRIVLLRTPSDVTTDLEASTRRQYIIRPGKPVILAERVDYFKPAGQRLFAGKYDPDPDYLRLNHSADNPKEKD